MNTKKAPVFGLMLVFFAFLFLAAPGLASKQSLIEDPLTEEEIAELSCDARTQYSQAITDMDHVSLDPALAELRKAFELEPKNTHLQMIAAQAYQLRGRTKSGSEASRLFENALEMIEVPLSNQDLPAETRERCEKMKASIEAEKENLTSRDAGRVVLAESIRKKMGNDASALTPTDNSGSKDAATKTSIRIHRKPSSSSGGQTAKKSINRNPLAPPNTLSVERQYPPPESSTKSSIELRKNTSREALAAASQKWDKEVHIGMPKQDFVNVIGQPSKVSRTVTASGVSEQWIYNKFPYSNIYVYFDNDVLTSWQDNRKPDAVNDPLMHD